MGCTTGLWYPRHPKVTAHHHLRDVRPLLHFEPSELREDLMNVMGFHLGLTPPREDSSHVPTRQVAFDVLQLRSQLTDMDVYIGPGHFSHRWPLTQWQNPFRTGEGRTALESVLHYARWIADQDHLLARLPSLHGKTLVCDCPHNVLCHGDIIRALVWTTSRPTSPSGQAHPTREQLRWVSLIAAGIRPARAVPLRFSQEIVVASLMALCPDVSWEGFQWPMLEDLLVDDSHYQWLNYMQNRSDWDGHAFGPWLVGPLERNAIAMSGLQQPGAAAAAKALPPMIPFGVGEERHFELALELQQRPTPFETMGVVDDDLIFAASGYAAQGVGLREVRRRTGRWLQELSRRMWPIAYHLQAYQPPPVRSATRGRHIALIGLIMLITGWPDTTFVANLIYGFPAVGFSPHVPVYKAQPAHYIPDASIYQDALPEAARIIQSLRPGEHDTAIVQAGEEDQAKGFCGPPMTWAQLCQELPQFRLIRRFCIQQPSGKLRVIDDAADGGQSALSSDANKLDLCTSIQPGLHVQLLWQAASSSAHASELLQAGVWSGVEDLPNAYRYVPMKPTHSNMAVVAYYDHHVGGPRFRQYYGSLFGLPNAVCSFNRFPRFFQAACRRLAYCVTSMYFDDLTIQDLGIMGGTGQAFVNELARCLGSPFQTEKHQSLAAQSDFLGLIHDVAACHQGAPVKFWVRDRLLTKVTDIMEEAIQTRRLPPGLAAKLFGCLGFLTAGCFGKLGRSGLHSIKERQYSSQVVMTPEIEQSFDRIRALLQLKPERELPFNPVRRHRYLAASDAAQERPREGSAGVLFIDPRGSRRAYVVHISPKIFTVWSNHEAKIAQLELLTVYMGLAYNASSARGMHGIWFVDNIAALMALIRGRSNNDELDSMAGAIHGLLFALRSACYFEWVQSKDNWSDGISRQGEHDTWFQRHDFRLFHTYPLLMLLQLPYHLIAQVFQFV